MLGTGVGSPQAGDRNATISRCGGWSRWSGALLAVSMCLSTGCELLDKWDQWTNPDPEIPAGAGEGDAMVFHGDQLVPDKVPTDPKALKATQELAAAQDLYRQGDFEKAEAIFHAIAENKKNHATLAEEARFFEAECLRREEKYPKAADTYHKTLVDFPSGCYREQCCQRLFDIANFWLEDTRLEMKLAKTREPGFHMTPITPVVHWEKEKPLLDEEGRAVEALEWVHINDIVGPLADKSLFLAGSVQFYRENYREADNYFTQLVEHHRNSPLAEQSIELAIISKYMGTGGPDYDGRKVAEARQMINTALANYPVLASQKKDFLIKQLRSCTMQEAAKDFRIAEFYARTGHPGSAYFYYEIVRRRYPGTPVSEDATQRMLALRHEVEVKQQAGGPPMPPMPSSATPGEETAPHPRPVGPEVGPAPRPVPANGLPPTEETAPSPSPQPAPPETAPAPQSTPPNMIGGGPH